MSQQDTATGEELYLILHKVRGEPAFDIAQRLQIGDEDGWIIPTSGHRAYPYRCWQLDELADVSDYPHARPADCCYETDGFASCPDHYSANPSPKTSIRELIRNLILRPPSTFKKRAW